MAQIRIRGAAPVNQRILTPMAFVLLLATTSNSWSADDAALTAQVEALRAAIAEQRAALDAQAKLLEAQQAQLEALTKQLGQQKIATQEVPKLTFSNNRPTITAADGRSSIAFRANVQLDGALYGESAEGPLTTDFRRGSVGGLPNRENNAARDFSDGFYFRRARFGVEGTIARDFNYRLLLELGGIRHRRSDAHQRRLDRLHGSRAIHVPDRCVLARRQHGRRHHSRRPALPRARQRLGACHARWAARTAASASLSKRTAHAG